MKKLDNLTKEDVEIIIDEIIKTVKNKERVFKIGIGKQEYIKFKCSCLEYAGADKEEIERFRNKLDRELEEGFYMIES